MTVPRNFWEDEHVARDARLGGFVSLMEIGDTAEGVIAGLSKRVFSEGTPDERLAIEVAFVEGPSLTAGQVMLKSALFELKPVPGDRLRVELAGIEKRGSKTMKKFKVEVTRSDGSVGSVDQTA